MPVRLKAIALLTLSLFLIFTPLALAVEIVITSSPNSARQLEEFEVGFSAQGLEAGAEYYLKSRIGKEGTVPTKGETYNPETNNWLSDSTSWTSFPVGVSNGNGDLLAFIRTRPKDSTEEGVNQLTVRLRKTDSSTNLNSSPVEIEITAMVLTPTPSSAPTQTPDSSSQEATYKINEVKDEEGNLLGNVKVYLDGVYLHHYAPETLTFCDDCHCDGDVDCGFGTHTIKLEKSDYQDWSETKTFDPGDSYEVNPVMEKTSLPSESSPTPSVKVSPLPTSKSLVKKSTSSAGKVLGGETLATTSFYPWEATKEAEEEEATSSRKRVLPLVFLGLGLAILGGAAYWLWYTFYWKGIDKNQGETL